MGDLLYSVEDNFSTIAVELIQDFPATDTYTRFHSGYNCLKQPRCNMHKKSAETQKAL